MGWVGVEFKDEMKHGFGLEPDFILKFIKKPLPFYLFTAEGLPFGWHKISQGLRWRVGRLLPDLDIVQVSSSGDPDSYTRALGLIKVGKSMIIWLERLFFFHAISYPKSSISRTITWSDYWLSHVGLRIEYAWNTHQPGFMTTFLPFISNGRNICVSKEHLTPS